MSAGVFAAIFAFTLAPWTIRNILVAQYPGFSTSGPFNLYAVAGSATLARLEGRRFTDVQRELINVARQGGRSQAAASAYMGSEGRRILLQHLTTYAVIHARGCFVVLADPYVTPLLRRLNLYPESSRGFQRATEDTGLVQSIGAFIVEYPLVLLPLTVMGLQLAAYYFMGLAGLFRVPRDAAWLFVIMAVYFVLVSGYPGAEGRLRTPIMPLVCISAGVYLASRQRAAESTQRRAAAGE